jgi:hypothetical protein
MGDHGAEETVHVGAVACGSRLDFLKVHLKALH